MGRDPHTTPRPYLLTFDPIDWSPGLHLIGRTLTLKKTTKKQLLESVDNSQQLLIGWRAQVQKGAEPYLLF